MLSEKYRDRYEPGRRDNSFFMDMTDKKQYKGELRTTDSYVEYTYYINSSGELVKEEL